MPMIPNSPSQSKTSDPNSPKKRASDWLRDNPSLHTIRREAMSGDRQQISVPNSPRGGDATAAGSLTHEQHTHMLRQLNDLEANNHNGNQNEMGSEFETKTSNSYSLIQMTHGAFPYSEYGLNMNSEPISFNKVITMVIVTASTSPGRQTTRDRQSTGFHRRPQCPRPRSSQMDRVLGKKATRKTGSLRKKPSEMFPGSRRNRQEDTPRKRGGWGR
jgi:hypothetical protein